MVNKRGHKTNRIPVHFVDDENSSTDASAEESGQDTGGQSEQDDLTSEEIGRESSYEDETEVARRIERGQESEDSAGQADDDDTAGAPNSDELPERREDRDEATSKQTARNHGLADGDEGSASPAGSTQATGPMLAELIATRAE